MSTTEQVLEKLQLAIEYVPVETLHPNPWNPNFESARVFESVKESIQKYGFVNPIAVRAHPDLPPPAWQILGGEHRWRGAKELGIETVPITDLGRNVPVDDVAAKKLTLALNTGGEPDLVPLGRLLADLSAVISLEDIKIGLPYETSELEHLLKLGSVNWDDFDPDANRTIDNALKNQANDERQHHVTLAFTKAAQRKKFDTFVAMLQREMGKDDATIEEAVLHGLTQACKGL